MKIKKKKDARERKERVHTHNDVHCARTHVYNMRREREDGEKKLISNTMPKRTRRPLYITPLAITRFSATESIVC